MKLCHLHFDAAHCFWKQDTNKPIQEQIELCRKLKCPHGTIMEKSISTGERVAFVSCDLSWNPFDNKPTTEQDREMMFP